MQTHLVQGRPADVLVDASEGAELVVVEAADVAASAACRSVPSAAARCTGLRPVASSDRSRPKTPTTLIGH